MEPSREPSLASALDALWTRFKPEMADRVATLEAAATTLAAGRLSPDERESAHAAAHKLAGALGTFGLTRGTDLARELELMYAREAGPDPNLLRPLAEMTAELRALVEGRS